MCDYSLEMYGSRPAREGELYVTTRFPSGSIGFASAGDPRTAVCMQCDTKVMLTNIPVALQNALRIGAEAETPLRAARGRPLSRRSAVGGRAFRLAARSAAWHSRLCAGAARARRVEALAKTPEAVD